jgi:uncharacterized membrane protein YheB (UPF0754 family)
MARTSTIQRQRRGRHRCRHRSRCTVVAFAFAVAAASCLLTAVPPMLLPLAVNGFSLLTIPTKIPSATLVAPHRGISRAQLQQDYYSRHSRHRLIVSAPSSAPSSLHRLTTTAGENDMSEKEENAKKTTVGPFKRAAAKFRARPGTYLLIPCIAALVGWFTNWLAVQMIFYPIKFRGIPLYQMPEVPLGLLGWQGIVPCKTRPMGEAMVEMVSTQLLTVREVFGRLDPKVVARLLAPRVPVLGQEIMADYFGTTATATATAAAAVTPARFWCFWQSLPRALYAGFDHASQRVLQLFSVHFLERLTRDMQANIDSIFSLHNCVLTQMLADRTMLGKLFQKCGQAELDFLTNSGLWFGFLLGLIQLVVALFYDNPWTLSIGGGIVGLATNWLALKWIFQPVDPVRIWGTSIVLQGQFLRRQKEVAKEFSAFFARNILTSQQLWNSVFTDPTTSPNFALLFTSHFTRFVRRMIGGFGLLHFLEPETLQAVTTKAIEKLPHHVPVLYSYMDKTMQLESTLRVRMEGMTSRQFERVLHPIFEEDELTLILAGAVLGFAAGLVQQGLETGQLKFPSWSSLTPAAISKTRLYQVPKRQVGRVWKLVKKTKGAVLERLSNNKNRTNRQETRRDEDDAASS